MITIFIIIYLMSFTLHLLLEYKENKRFIHNVGDLIDNIRYYMWFPLLNTLILIIGMVGIFIYKLPDLLRLDVIWRRFRDIRLR